MLRELLADSQRETDLKAAQLAAQRRAKYLLVVLLSRDNWRCNAFMKMVDEDPEIVAMLTDSFHVFIADVDTADGSEHMSSFGATALPFVAVGAKRRFVLSMEGKLDAALVKMELQNAMELGAPDIAKEIAFQAERQERESLRAQQEQALAEAMRIDRERAERKAAERAAQAQREAEEREAQEREAQAAREREEQLAREAAEAARRAEELELRRAQALSAVPEEPPADAPADEVGTLKVVGSDGSAVMRRFRASDTVGGLFAFAESLPSFQGGEYQLVCGFPPKPLDREALSSTPLSEVRTLWPRSVVTVRPIL